MTPQADLVRNLLDSAKSMKAALQKQDHATLAVLTEHFVNEVESIGRQLETAAPKPIPPEYVPKTMVAVLGKLSEECGEIVKAVGKTLRFGLLSSNPDVPPEKRRTNQEAILQEIEDLEATIPLVREALANRTPGTDTFELPLPTIERYVSRTDAVVAQVDSGHRQIIMGATIVVSAMVTTMLGVVLFASTAGIVLSTLCGIVLGAVIASRKAPR